MPVFAEPQDISASLSLLADGGVAFDEALLRERIAAHSVLVLRREEEIVALVSFSTEQARMDLLYVKPSSVAQDLLQRLVVTALSQFAVGEYVTATGMGEAVKALLLLHFVRIEGDVYARRVPAAALALLEQEKV